MTDSANLAVLLLLIGIAGILIEASHPGFGVPGIIGAAALVLGILYLVGVPLPAVDLGWPRDPTRIENIRDALCALDRWGQKKGAGFYDYDEKRRPSPSPVVQGIIDDFRAKAGVEKREISDQEIVERTLYTMVNEGAKILEEGMAQRASDIDVVWVYGYGWPVARGGPMFYADQVGLAKIAERLTHYAEQEGDESLRPAALLYRLAAEGKGFSSLSA